MVQIEPLSASLLTLLQAHLARHENESGQGEPHFMPMLADPVSDPAGPKEEVWRRELDQPGWQRWFLALTPRRQAIGHVELTGASLASALHRCRLGIGIERGYRGQGLGRALMRRAIGFAAAQPGLDWIDLRVFAHNQSARALYRSLGFEELGVVADQFRVSGTSIDDVRMALALADRSAELPAKG